MHVAVEGVIGDISHQKNRGKDKRGEHGCPVLANPFHPDEKEADHQGYSGESIEQSVSLLEEKGCWVPHWVVGSQETVRYRKRLGHGADCDNTEDYADWS